MGNDCTVRTQCFPQAPTHATWCAPFEGPFDIYAPEGAPVPGTIDGADAELGCHCLRGWCGAALNDGRIVVGPQPDADGATYPPECTSPLDCFPQAPGHATWCGPIEHDFSQAVVTAIYVEGTLDGDDNVGCRCLQGRCGARLNDGRLVRGPQFDPG
ncbi:MAG: hypothetical protein KUG77_16385 [Nannocystaceae bacterium]|nr:hypothetical protein [Nannocystaceae bacterium]